MAKKIKITEAQLRMLNKRLTSESVEEKPNGRVMKITEAQFNRLFKKKLDESVINEDIGIFETFLDFGNYMIGWLNDLSTSESTSRLDPIWIKLGMTEGDFFNTLMDLGIITTVAVKGKDVYKWSRAAAIKNLKKLYNNFAKKPRYDKDGKVIGKTDNAETEAVSEAGLPGDFELPVDETTSTGGVGGSFEAPMSGTGPQKKFKNYPSDELNEDNIDETTTTGDASGAYVQPKIWAKDPENSRFSNDPMYPEGQIIKKQ